MNKPSPTRIAARVLNKISQASEPWDYVNLGPWKHHPNRDSYLGTLYRATPDFGLEFSITWAGIKNVSRGYINEYYLTMSAKLKPGSGQITRWAWPVLFPLDAAPFDAVEPKKVADRLFAETLLNGIEVTAKRHHMRDVTLYGNRKLK